MPECDKSNDSNKVNGKEEGNYNVSCNYNHIKKDYDNENGNINHKERNNDNGNNSDRDKGYERLTIKKTT